MGSAGSNHRDANNVPQPRPLRVTIPSNFIAGREVQRKILEEVERFEFNAHNSFAVKLALEEALINAIKHGNKLDPTKLVHIEANVTPAQVEIIIEDEGAGFDRSQIPDPLADENLEKCSGRGILLIESYMTEARWTNGGRKLRMVKRNS